jgi:hypothetical protein
MSSESVSALGQPSETKPTVGAREAGWAAAVLAMALVGVSFIR